LLQAFHEHCIKEVISLILGQCRLRRLHYFPQFTSTNAVTVP